jgi:hypothetical protein
MLRMIEESCRVIATCRDHIVGTCCISKMDKCYIMLHSMYSTIATKYIPLIEEVM